MSLLSLFAQTQNDMYAVGMSHAAADAAVAGLLVFFLIFAAAAYIIISIMLARIFQKAGIKGWKAWVPVYNTWTMLELGEQKGWWAILMLFPVINIVAMVFMLIAMYNIGRHFGKDDYFVLWAIFVPIVWYAWLAFDNSTWRNTPSAPAITPTDPAKE